MPLISYFFLSFFLKIIGIRVIGKAMLLITGKLSASGVSTASYAEVNVSVENT